MSFKHIVDQIVFVLKFQRISDKCWFLKSWQCYFGKYWVELISTWYRIRLRKYKNVSRLIFDFKQLIEVLFFNSFFEKSICKSVILNFIDSLIKETFDFIFLWMIICSQFFKLSAFKINWLLNLLPEFGLKFFAYVWRFREKVEKYVLQEFGPFD